jgi:hypothetical protein
MITLLCGGTIIGVLADRFPNQANWQAQVLASLAIFEQMHDLLAGSSIPVSRSM